MERNISFLIAKEKKHLKKNAYVRSPIIADLAHIDVHIHVVLYKLGIVCVCVSVRVIIY